MWNGRTFGLLPVTLREYHLANKANRVIVEAHQSLVLICWKSPSFGWVKVNMDGSCKEGGCIWSSEVIRGSDGEWLRGFSKFIGHGSPYPVGQ